jgi:hypothetical protein
LQLAATMREASTTLETSQKTAQAVEAKGRTLTGSFDAFIRGRHRGACARPFSRPWSSSVSAWRCPG